MGKFIKFLAAAAVLCTCSFAQDMLIRCDGKMKKAFVVNISPDRIDYKTDKSESDFYSVRRDEILTVIFENGEQQTFECQQVQARPQTGAVVSVETNISGSGSSNAALKIADAAAAAAINQAAGLAQAGINNVAQNITGNIVGGKLGAIGKGGLKGAAQNIGKAAATAAVNQAADIAQAGINNVAQNITGNIAGKLLNETGDIIRQGQYISELAQDGAQRKKSRAFLAFRYMLLSPIVENSGVMQGYEYEIGGIKRDKLLMSGTTFFAHGFSNDSTLNTSWSDYLNIGFGGGFFIAPVISGGDTFKFVPGLNLGLWAYEYNRGDYDYYDYDYDYNYNYDYDYRYNNSHYDWAMEVMWGGPDIRMMFGKTVFFEIFYKMQFGIFEGSNYHNYSYYDDGAKFKVRQLWGIGISFSIKASAGCQCQ